MDKTLGVNKEVAYNVQTELLLKASIVLQKHWNTKD